MGTCGLYCAASAIAIQLRRDGADWVLRVGTRGCDAAGCLWNCYGEKRYTEKPNCKGIIDEVIPITTLVYGNCNITSAQFVVTALCT